MASGYRWPCPATFTTLLPSEPRIALPAVAEALSGQYLFPYLAALEALFLELRAQVDPLLTAAAPFKYGKPYPLGQCLEITLAIQKQLAYVDAAHLSAMARQGHQALIRFLASKGSVRRVWGDLRGQYFQNALLIGSLYVDVSNDTVVITKPKVEILTFHASGLRPIQDYDHFACIATRYWQVRMWPNHALPDLAPSYAMVTVTKGGRVELQEPGDYLVALNWQKAFRPAESYLAHTPMPPAVFSFIINQLGKSHARPACDPNQGRRLALEMTRLYRKKRWHQQRQSQQHMLFGGRAANQLLACRAQSTPASRRSHSQPTSPDKIEPAHGLTDRWSPRAIQLHQSLQWTDAEIFRLQTQLAAMHTARNACVRAFKSALLDTPLWGCADPEGQVNLVSCH
jgi:hypothetical protein